MPQIFTLGQGVFTWPNTERVSDRYGAIGFEKGDGIDFAHTEDLDKVVGYHGTLKGRVIETRQSHHIGDFVRGLFPTTPLEGQEFTIGTGTFQREHKHGMKTLVCIPDDGRLSDWYDPKVLYQLHDQVVLLWIEVTE